MLYVTGVAALSGVTPHMLYVTGVAALSGTSITGEVYAWVVVFLLPINSAINPVLYTISAIKPLELLKKVNSSTFPFS